MIIGIVGSCGVVGSASKFGFEKLGHKVIGHDLKLGTKITDVIDAEIVYISVPTPDMPDGSCDTSIVESVVKELRESGYSGIIGIRSTITPGTTSRLNKHDFKICFVPEFLRERCAVSDFVENNNLLAIGAYEKLLDLDLYGLFDKVEKSFGHYPKRIVRMTETEAELLKYFHNFLAGLRVVWAAEMYKIASKMGANYTTIKNAILSSAKMPDQYLDVNESMQGYSSVCLNKDIPALVQLAEELDLDLPLMRTVPIANDNFKKTPFADTREHY